MRTAGARLIARFALAAAAAFCLLPASARAGGCLAFSSGFHFGVYNPLATTNAIAVSAVHVVCSQLGKPVTVTVDLSAGTSQTYAYRTMFPEPKGGAGKPIQYNVYFNGTAAIFGNGLGGTAHYVKTLVPDKMGAAADTFLMTALAPPGQDVLAAVYDDDGIELLTVYR